MSLSQYEFPGKFGEGFNIKLSSLRYAFPVSLLATFAAVGVGGALGVGGVTMASQLSTDPCAGQDWCFSISLGFVAMSAVALCIAVWAAARAFLIVKDGCISLWVPTDQAAAVRSWLGAVTAGWILGGYALLSALDALVG